MNKDNEFEDNYFILNKKEISKLSIDQINYLLKGINKILIQTIIVSIIFITLFIFLGYQITNIIGYFDPFSIIAVTVIISIPIFFIFNVYMIYYWKKYVKLVPSIRVEKHHFFWTLNNELKPCLLEEKQKRGKL